jgi:cytochrome d ubiquinol oxidase subunit I
MNQPRGFALDHAGNVVNPDPVKAMFNPATPVETTHMIFAAYLVAGFGVASVYAWSWLRGNRDRYTRLGFLIPFTFAAVFAVPQVVVGDWAARFLAERQPVKLAAIEGLERTQRGAPLHVGGIVKIPKGLSLLAHHDPDAEVIGLDSVPPEDRPPLLPVRIAFQVMVGIGTGLVVLAGWYAVAWRRRKDLPRSRLFGWAAVAAGPAAVVALEAGWIVTEVGRQPWIVYGYVRTADAVTHAGGIRYGYYALLVIYTAMTAATVYVLRRLARLPREDRTDPAAPEPMG